MNYYVCYPISYDCNLRCHYCFHSERFNTNYTQKRKFSVPDYIKFRDTHLKNPQDILVHFHGGEPFINTNINSIISFIRQTKIERFDLLTNGIQSRSNYEKLISFKDRIHRIGFTFHRSMISSVSSLVKRYEDNLLWMHEQGFPVYYKELLFVRYREEIKKSKKRWLEKGIQVKIQDYKGHDHGKSREEYQYYTPEDYLLIDAEYKHGGEYCSCVKNYKNIIIRGGWQDGDVLACFEDPKVVGNIQENWYHPNYHIYKDMSKGRIDVRGVDPIYRGTWDRDIYKPKQCGKD